MDLNAETRQSIVSMDLSHFTADLLRDLTGEEMLLVGGGKAHETAYGEFVE